MQLDAGFVHIQDKDRPVIQVRGLQQIAPLPASECLTKLPLPELGPPGGRILNTFPGPELGPENGPDFGPLASPLVQN